MRTQPQDIIARLEADPSKLAKQAIIKQAVDENLAEFFDGLRMALDMLYTFGVKQVPVKEQSGGQGLPWQAFVYVAEKLHSRELTGHAARDAIQLAMDTATQEQWNGYYRRILIKDLRCGMSEKTVNKVCKAAKREDLGIPIFSCQLAHDAANHEKKMKGKKLLDVKLDGCLSESWEVEFEDGTKIKIKEVVENQLQGRIKSFNTITGKVEFNEILNWAVDGVDKTESNYEWFELTLEDGKVLPPLTGNHLIYLPKLKCYRRADLLVEGDEVLLDI